MRLFLKTKDFSVSKENFELLYDEALDMLITNPVPKDPNKYYQSENYISHTDSQKSFVDKLYQRVKKYSLKKKVSLIDEYSFGNKSVLDIGAGTGDFLALAKENEWIVNGVEPNTKAVHKASEKGIQLSTSLRHMLGKKFQLITLWHVLEHLPNLENQIRSIVDLMEEEGTLIIAVPNFKSWDAKHYGKFWAAYDVPRHLWHFSRTTISNLFSKHGMKVVTIKPMVFDSFYVSILSEKYKTGNSNFVRAFVKGLYSNISAWSSKEYSSLIYILKKA